MIAPLAIDLRALRTLVGPDINIVPGRAMMARVVAAPEGGRGSLSIAGFLLEAELPANVQAGQDLRLVVRDVNQERVLLAISPHDRPGTDAAQTPPQTQAQAAHAAQTPQPPTPPPLAVPLPGGGMLHVTERDASGGGGGSASGESGGLSLRYEAPALGAVDLRLALDPGTVHVGVTLPAAAAALAQADADSLRRALAAAVPDRSVDLTIAPRREPLDVYA